MACANVNPSTADDSLWTDPSIPRLVADPNGIIQRANSAAQELFGYPELVGTSINYLMMPEFAKHHEEHMSKFFASERSRNSMLSHVQTSSSSTPLMARHSSGEAFSVNIYLRKNESNLEAAITRVKTPVNPQREANGVLHHISGMVSMQKDNPQALLFLCSITGPPGGYLEEDPIDLENFDVMYVCRLSFSSLLPLFEQRGIQLELRVPEEARYISAQRSLLIKYIIELLSHILNERQITSITCEVKEESGGIAVVVRAIGEKFEANQKTSKVVLPCMEEGKVEIWRNYCAKLSGVLDITEYKKLYHVIATFPFRVTKMPIARQPTLQDLLASHQITLAHADDEKVARELFSNYMHRKGYKVLSFEDGQSLVDHLEQREEKPVDYVFLDGMMPRLDGYAAAAKLRQIFEKKRWRIPIYAITGNSDEDGKAKFTRAGVSQVFGKPIPLATIKSCIESDISSQQAVADTMGHV